MYPRGPAAAALRAAGVPVYESVEQAAGALGRLAAAGDPPPRRRARARRRRRPGRPATATRRRARCWPPPASRSSRSAPSASAGEALAAARELGYPVVLKALGQLHKSDAGGVVIGLADDAALGRALADMARRLAPERCSVERMAPLADGVELLIGTRWDARFGPVALAGSGGVYAEILRDTAVALAPVSRGRRPRRCCARCARRRCCSARGAGPALDVGRRRRGAGRPVARWPPPIPSSPSSRSTPCWSRPPGALALDARFVRAIPPHRSERVAVHLHRGAARAARPRQPPDRRHHPVRGALRGRPRPAAGVAGRDPRAHPRRISSTPSTCPSSGAVRACRCSTR